MREVALRNKTELSRNERELNANGTVDNVVGCQFLYTLNIKFPKTGCNIYNNCSLHTAIFLMLQHAYLARLIISPLIISLRTKRFASVFLRQLFCHLKVLLRSKLHVTYETKIRSLQLIRCGCTCLGH